MKDFEQTRALVDRVQQCVIGRRVTVDETVPDSETMIFFDREIAWFRETRSQFQLLEQGLEAALTEGSNYSDFYGFMTSFSDPIEIAIKSARKRRLDRESYLEACVVMTVEEFAGVIIDPKQIDRNQFVYSNSTLYRSIPVDWIDVSTPSARVVADTWLNTKGFARMDVERPQFISGTRNIETINLWSSRKTAEENRQSILRTAERFALGKLDDKSYSSLIEEADKLIA